MGNIEDVRQILNSNADRLAQLDAVSLVTFAFGVAQNDDLILGRLFFKPLFSQAWDKVAADTLLQSNFMRNFDQKHGKNETVNERIATVLKSFEKRGQSISKFQAVGFIVSHAMMDAQDYGEEL